MTLLLALLACGGPQQAAPPTPVEPAPLAGTTCAACGMVVAEQPPPRGQVLHRDGTHAHLCSIGDLRAYLQAPNPHGQPLGTWVEALPAGYDPADTRSAALPWHDAETAHYVVGFHRPATMGRPALSFADAAAAAEASVRVGGHVVTWGDLRATPHHQDP